MSDLADDIVRAILDKVDAICGIELQPTEEQIADMVQAVDSILDDVGFPL